VPFSFRNLELPGVVLIEPQVFSDDRGFFMETFKGSNFAANGIPERFAQENHSSSRRGVLRGLHIQRPPKAQGKLVRVVAGEIFDVVVDVLQGSTTYGTWVAQVLSSDNKGMLYIPPWCLHGFVVTSDTAEVVYLATEEYAPDYEGGVVWDDPDLAIRWPIEEPVLSEKDRALPRLRDAQMSVARA